MRRHPFSWYAALPPVVASVVNIPDTPGGSRLTEFRLDGQFVFRGDQE